SRSGMLDNEQPGCLHAGMDLYKWAMKISPIADSALVVDCFDLAADIRTLDMEASPYDLRGWGYGVVAVETAAGKAEYMRRQKEVSARAQSLRQRLLDALASAGIHPRCSSHSGPGVRPSRRSGGWPSPGRMAGWPGPDGTSQRGRAR